jgi:hypothetical protein
MGNFVDNSALTGDEISAPIPHCSDYIVLYTLNGLIPFLNRLIVRLIVLSVDAKHHFVNRSLLDKTSIQL